MTTGQRIAAKRKEYKLSQEALGEQLGVSRQSIYKWESDASLPEIDKLVALSRLFSVSVGWLLGVEDAPPEAAEAEQVESERSDASQAPNELTPAQLKMVEEIVSRYLAAQPKPRPRRLLVRVLVALAVVGVGMNLFSRLDQLDNRYNNLQNSIGNISSNVNNQINGITNRVEEVLKAQNDLTADYDTKYTTADLAANTITFELYAVPKTYIPGMEVIFLADHGGEPVTVTATEDTNQKFSAQLTCPLTDSITLSAVFVTGETRQTQLLDNYSGLYSGSLPDLDLRGLETTYLHSSNGKDGQFQLPAAHGWTRDGMNEAKFGTVEISSCQVGLFHNWQLVRWLESAPTPENWEIGTETVYQLPELDISLEEGDILHFAAIYTDEYGRQGVAPSIPSFECMGDEISWMQSSDGNPYYNLENYVF